MNGDLYSRSLSGSYLRACGTNEPGTSDPDQESCVEFAPLSGGGYALRDSKNPDAGEQRYTREELDAFVARYQGL